MRNTTTTTAGLARAVLFTVAVVFAASCEREAKHADNPTPADSPAPTTTPVSGPTFADFSDRLNVYMDLRQKVENGLPKMDDTSDPAKISAREKALGDAIRNARPGAKPGDVFSEAAVKEFRRIIEENFNSRPPADQGAVLEEVPMKVVPRVNDSYPTDMPLATVPPSLLLNLPTLPEVLEYRFLGRHFILRDVKANVIVDVVPDAVPAPAANPALGAGRHASPKS
jgi:hypothetical protein